MNTDNMTVSGETIDYGPCAFMDAYDPSTVFSSIDREGRYAYGNQGPIALWNLARFAECLLPLFDTDVDRAINKAETTLGDFSDLFNDYWLTGMRKKIGLVHQSAEDETLVGEFLQIMRDSRADFTLAFRHLAECVDPASPAANFRQLFASCENRLDPWLEKWRARLTQQKRNAEETVKFLNAQNPLYIPRNQNVENALRAAVEEGDYQPFEELLKVLRHPWVAQEGMEKYAEQPAENAGYKTFCGT